MSRQAEPVLRMALWLLPCLALVFGISEAREVEIPNASIESGLDTPEHWTLSGGKGEWQSGDAADGNRALVLIGDASTDPEENTNRWTTDPLALEPNSLYQVRFKVRNQGGRAGYINAGLSLTKHDWDMPPPRWAEYGFPAVTPKDLTPETSRLDVGQWMVLGSVAYDDVRLAKVQPVYLQVDDVALGAGESVTGCTYTFRAPYECVLGAQSRPLLYHQCSFNTTHWVFADRSEVVYKHEIAGRSLLTGDVRVGIGLYQGGELVVEAATDPDSWREIGVLGAPGDKVFQVPETLLPAKALFVRLRGRHSQKQQIAEASGPKDTTGETATFLVNRYGFESTLDGKPMEHEGATQFATVSHTDPSVEVDLLSLGQGVPGGRNEVALKVRNNSVRTLKIQPTVTLYRREIEYAAYSTEATVTEKSVATIWVPYELVHSGGHTLRVTLGNAIPYSVESDFYVPALYDASYGERLPGSTKHVGLWWTSSGWKVNKDRSMPQSKGEGIRIRAARNETEAAQLVVRPTRALKGFVAEATELTGPNGAQIASDAVEVLRVRYVPIVEPSDWTGAVAPWPDPLPPFNGPIDLEVDANQPLWVRVSVSQDAPAGFYSGQIKLEAQGYRSEVPLQVEVYDFSLPDATSVATMVPLDYALVFRYHGVTSPEDQRLVAEKYLRNFGAHHVSPGSLTPLDELKVTWPDAKTAAESDPSSLKPVIDWTNWDTAMARAIDDSHVTWHMLPPIGMGGGTFHSQTAPTLAGFAEGTPQYNALFRAYWHEMQEHLREKGWLDGAYVYFFDEPSPNNYETVRKGYEKLKDAAPDIKRFVSEQPEPQMFGGPNMWCAMTPSFDPKAAEARRKLGEWIWWYVCSEPKAPYCTVFIDHAGTEMRIWLWQTWQRGITGAGTWQSTYWTSDNVYPSTGAVQNPYEDPMSWVSGYGTYTGVRMPWGNGDGRFLYPPEAAADGHPDAPVLDDPVDSIRWEVFRDGIEDYEYLVLLRCLLEEASSALSPDQQRAFQQLLEVPDTITADVTSFTSDPAIVEARRHEIAKAIEALRRQ